MKNKNIRKIARIGNASLGITLPIEYLAALGWREKQKVVVEKKGRHLIIKDWKK
jgi:antitoxin component of MazEF toxin-antitoxin module